LLCNSLEIQMFDSRAAIRPLPAGEYLADARGELFG
jgi:hypothetical protein